jgi:aryl-alcohol dehydrogenase-like predicted oxidoreductase
MKFRRFGRTGWQVGEIGYGMWGMAGWTGSQDAESLASLERAIDLGCNFFDTAWAYGDGHSEELLGKALRANPSKQLYVATKVPPKNRQWPSQRTLSSTYPIRRNVFRVRGKSLRNIGTDTLDLIQYPPGKTNGSRTNAQCARWKNCARAEKFVPSESA